MLPLNANPAKYAQLQGIVRDKCGLVFDETKIERLHDALHARMSRKNIADPDIYCARLLSDTQEFSEFVNLLTINETYFMRESSHIDLMVERLIPLIISSRPPGQRIRIVSAGCSSGEEAYSVTMALLNRFGQNSQWQFDITGFDIDSETLLTAQKGVYSNHSFRGVAPELIDKYFDRLDNNRYAIKDIVKDKVNFIKLNFMADTYPAILNNTDIILYRNVSIYFDADTQRKIFDKLAAILSENGYLFMSATETLAHNLGVLTLREIEGMFLFQKGSIVEIADRRQHKPKTPAVQAKKTATAVTKTKMKTEPAAYSPVRATDTALFDEAIKCAMQKRYDQALKLTDEVLRNKPSLKNAIMLKASVLLNLKRFDEAERICTDHIETDRWHLESHLLLGLISHAREDAANALKRFKETLYIDSSCWLAHFYLADILRANGDSQSAAREYSIVINILSRPDAAGHGLTYFPLSYSQDQIVHLCEHNLARLSGAGR